MPTEFYYPISSATHDLPSAHLLLAGRGTAEARLHALALSLRSASRIHFLGRVAYDRILDIFRAADLFLFASMTETQGLVVAEALAVGLPVVALKAPGVDEAVADGVTGVLASSLDELALALRALLLDPLRRRALGDAALAQAWTLSAETQVDRMILLYQHLLGQPEPAAAGRG